VASPENVDRWMEPEVTAAASSRIGRRRLRVVHADRGCSACEPDDQAMVKAVFVGASPADFRLSLTHSLQIPIIVDLVNADVVAVDDSGLRRSPGQ
jgi:hypothetical protein